MKKILFLGFAVIVALSVLATNASTAAAAISDNLILNPSLETASSGDATIPANWSQGGFGDNTRVFTYPVAGHTGATDKAAKVAITSYPNVGGNGGDAKWAFKDVTVTTPSTQYFFQDFYISDVPTELLVQETDSLGVAHYFASASVPAAASWQPATIAFITQPTTVSVTVFHRISQVGTLTVDDFELLGETSSTITDWVPNNSFEDVELLNPTLPASWTPSTYGVNTAVFQHVSGDAHTGSKSAKVTVSNYTDGDAKWIYDPQAMPAGDYKFSAWYKTNTIPRVVAQFTQADNSVSYFGMPNPEPSANATTVWQQYSSEFSVPTGVTSVSVYFFLSNNGWVQTDDYKITPYTYTGFDRPLVTLTFDDGAEQNVTNVLPILDGYGFKTTQCYATGFVENEPDPVIKAKQVANVQAFETSGHELCSHTVTHPFLTQLTPTDVDFELAHAQTYLQSITDQPIANFASPYGDYNVAVNNQIKLYYGAHRTVDEGYNSKDNFSIYRLRVQNMVKTTTLAEYQQWINKAIADKTWLILVYHKVGNETENIEEFDTLQADFNAQMSWLNTAGIAVVRMDQALAEIKEQINPTAPAMPVANPIAGTYEGTQSVTLSSTGSTSIRYATDDTVLDCAAAGTLYTGPISVAATTTIKAVGCKSGVSSTVGTFGYTITAPAPVVSVEVGGNATTSSITITWTTDHASTSRVVYDTVSHNPVVAPAPNYGYTNSTVEDATLVTNHSVTVTGLSAGTTYFFRPVSHGSPETYGNEISMATSSQPSSGGGGGGGSGGSGGHGGGTVAGSTVSAHPNGTLILDGQTIYLIKNNQRFGFRNGNEYLSHGYRFNQVVAANAADKQLAFPATNIIKALPGTLVLDASDKRTVYMIGQNNTKRGFASQIVFKGLGYSFTGLLSINLSDYAAGPVIASSTEAHPEGALVLDGATVWWIIGGTRQGFESNAVFGTYGFSFARTVKANSADRALPQGSLVKFRDGTLVNSGGNYYIVSDGQSRAFASATAFTNLGYLTSNAISASLSTYTPGAKVQ